MLPGLAAADGSTIAIRSALSAQGFRVHRWNLGRNIGPTAELTSALRNRFLELAEREGRPISLVGWSMGGLYAHRLAQFAPYQVRSVITLGSPLGRGEPRPRLDVPTASIFSRSDGLVPWPLSRVDDTAPRHENIEARSAHFLLGFDPAILYAISDRLRCEPDRWEPFRASRLMRTAFRSGAGP